MVIALNQVDVAESKGIHIDSEKLSELLGVPVIATVGTKNIDISELIAKLAIYKSEDIMIIKLQNLIRYAGFNSRWRFWDEAQTLELYATEANVSHS